MTIFQKIIYIYIYWYFAIIHGDIFVNIYYIQFKNSTLDNNKIQNIHAYSKFTLPTKRSFIKRKILISGDEIITGEISPFQTK